MKRKTTNQVDTKSASLATRAGYGEVLQKILDEGICPFCEENIFKHHKKPLLFKNKYWLATENAWPYKGARKHFILVSRLHIDSATEGPTAMWTDLAKAFNKLTEDFKLKGATLLMRSGDTAYTGATVRHLHAQVISGAKRKTESEPIQTVVGYQK